MKFYISARTAKVKEVKEMTSTLVDMGHEVTFDWTLEDAAVRRPYDPEWALLVAEKEKTGISKSDFFIILGDSSGTGMYVELGIALANNCTVYAIGENNDATVFHYLKNVKRFNSFSDVVKNLS